MLEVCRQNNRLTLINMGVHVGELVKKIAEENDISPTDLGKKINLHRASIHELYKREHIRTDVLEKLSQEFNYDFFEHISKSIFGDQENINEPKSKYKTKPHNAKALAPQKETEKVGFTFFIDVDNIDDFQKEFKEFLRNKKSS